MKIEKRLFIVMALCLTILSGCARFNNLTNDQDLDAQTPNQGENGTQNPLENDETDEISGMITEVSDTAITIRKNPLGASGDIGNGPRIDGEGDVPSVEEGTESPQNPDGAAGTLPDDETGLNSGTQKQTTPEGTPQQAPADVQNGDADTSAWEEITIKIDDDTKITKGPNGANNGTEESGASVDDLLVNRTVFVTMREDGSGFADTIRIMAE